MDDVQFSIQNLPVAGCRRCTAITSYIFSDFSVTRDVLVSSRDGVPDGPDLAERSAVKEEFTDDAEHRQRFSHNERSKDSSELRERSTQQWKSFHGHLRASRETHDDRSHG